MRKNQLLELASHLRNERGMGLLSTLGGLAVAAIVAGVVSYSVYNTKFAAKSAGGSDLCSDRASSVLNALSANSNKSLITNWHPSTGDLAPSATFSVTGQPRLPGGVSVAPLPGPGVPINVGDTNMWALIESSYNWLAQVYNDPNAVGVCSMAGEGLDLTTAALNVLQNNGFRVNATPMLRGERVFVNLKRVNQRTGQVDCTRPILMVPPSPGTFAAGVDTFGLRVTVTVAWTGNDDLPRTCRRETTLQPDGDRQPPNLDAPSLYPNAILNPAPGACGGADPARAGFCTCTGAICVTAPCAAGDGGCQTMGGAMDPNPLYAAFMPKAVRMTLADRYFPGSVSTCARAGGTASFSFSAMSTEPATLFTCGIAQAGEAVMPGAVNNYSQCVSFSSGPITGNLTAKSTLQNQPTGVRFEAFNLPVGSHRFSFKAIDHARNTTDNDAIVNVLNPCPADHTRTLCPDGGAIDKPNICGEPNQCVGTKPPACPPANVYACKVPLPPDPCGNVCGLGTGPAAGPEVAAGNPADYQGGYLDTCGFCTQGGTCVPSDGPDGIAGNADDVTCITNACAGAPAIPVPCATMNVATCPVLEFRPFGSAGPYNAASYSQTGAPVQMRVAGGGLPGGCTVEYMGQRDGITNALVGPVNTTADPNYNTTFSPAGPGNSSQGFRTLSLDCGGGNISEFEFRSQCGPAFGMPADQCNFSCVQATCR